MKPLFQRRKSGANSTQAGSAQARLTLAVFGKHPGWDDHILGIGAETETLVRVKQALYVQGIGGQIDSGAWEKLESDKRVPGYDHTFVWLVPDHVVVGLLWSSRDGKGRSKYPMVLCIDAEGLSPRCVLQELLPGLELLRAACKASTSAEQVTRDCRAGQEQLRSLLARGELHDSESAEQVKRNFLQRPGLGPDQVGLRRVLHELGTTSNARSRHVRLPLAGDTQREGLALWPEFLACALPDADSLLLIGRAGCDWLDAVVGEPASSDLFCLQASRKAVPLASEIPYDLPPDSGERMRTLEAAFLGVESRPVTAAPTSPSKETKPLEPQPAALRPPVGRGKRTPFWLTGGSLVVVAAVAGVWMMQSARNSQNLPPLSSSTTNEPPKLSENETKYLAALKEGQAAFERKEYSNALSKAELALSIKPDDPAATELKRESQAQLKSVADTTDRNRMYGLALAEITNAWQRGEAALQTGQYDLALTELTAANNQCAKARELGDASLPDRLLELLAARGAAVQAARKAMANGQQFAAAMHEATNAWQRAEAALQKAQYQGALAELSAASNLCMNARTLGDTSMVDRLAAVLEARRTTVQQASQNALAKAEQYAGALTEATNAWNRAEQAAKAGRYDTALAELKAATNQCALARGVGLVAPKLQSEGGDTGIPDRLAVVLETRRKELQASKDQLQRAEDQFAKGEYDGALAICDSQPGNQTFQDLKARISAEQNVLRDYSTKFSQGDYSFVDPLKDGSYRDKPPFASLYVNGDSEKRVLVQLTALKQANNTTELKKRLADPASAALATKPPFQALRQWAETAADTAANPGLLDKLESRLEVLSVWFNLLSPKKALTADGKAARRLSGSLSPEDTDKYVNEVRDLKKQFEQGGWLTPAREQELNTLEETIRTRL